MLEPISIRAGGQGNCCDGGEVEGKGQSVMARGGGGYLWPWLQLGVIWNRLLPMCSLGCDWAERRWGGPALPDAE